MSSFSDDPLIVRLRLLKNDNVRLINRDVLLTRKIEKSWSEIKNIKKELEHNNADIKQIEEWLEPVTKKAGQLNPSQTSEGVQA